VNDEQVVGLDEGDDLQVEIAIVRADPHQSLRVVFVGRNDYRLGVVDDVHRPCLADPVPSG
jgi:hypothetical protein